MKNQLDYSKSNNSGWHVTKFSAKWNNGSNAGSFYWNFNNSSGNSNRNIGGHSL